MTPAQQEEQSKEIEVLMKEFEERFSVLKKEQDKIISDFIEGIRQREIEKLRASINSKSQ